MSFRYIELMRQRRGLEKDDTSLDDKIAAMQPIERLRLICGWELGDPQWADQFVNWATDCGFDLAIERAGSQS